MIGLLEKLRQARKRPTPTGRRRLLMVEALEDRLTPIIAILIGHPVPPLAAAIAPSQPPPVSLVQFQPEVLLNQLMSNGAEQSVTAPIAIEGHSASLVSESPTTASDPMYINFQSYELQGQAKETVLPPSASANGIIVVSYHLSGRLNEGISLLMFNGQHAPIIWRADGTVTLEGQLTETATPSGAMQIGLQGMFTTDATFHLTEAAKNAILIGLLFPVPWEVDATTHAMGQLDETFEPSVAPNGFLTSTFSATDQIQVSLAPMLAAGETGPAWQLTGTLQDSGMVDVNLEARAARVRQILDQGTFKGSIMPPPGSGGPVESISFSFQKITFLHMGNSDEMPEQGP
jgi:hypothetical protein